MASSIEICKICDVQNILVVAEYWCSECEESLCEKCFAHHRISKSTKKHMTISIENYKELPQCIRDIKHQCAEHNETYQNYCLNHDVPLCKNCVVTTHKHCNDTTTIDAVTENAKSSVALHFLECRIADVHLNVQNIMKDRKENLKMIIDEENGIQEQISNDRRIVNELIDRLEHQMKLESLAVKNRLKHVIEDFKTKDTKLKQTRDTINKIKSYASEIQVFLGMKEIENQVQIDEQNIDSIITDGRLNQIGLRFKRNSQIESQLADFGQIFTVENPSTIRLVRRELKQAQQYRENKIDCTQNSNKENLGRQHWAQISYEAAADDELTIEQGDMVTVLDASDLGWWLVSKYDSQNKTVKGLVPANYLIPDELYLYEWFFGIASKEERDKLMLRNGKVSGSFMVTESAKDTYTLSVLHRDNIATEGFVHDYSINHHNISGYYLNAKEKIYFSSVPNLIKHYSHTADGLCTKLTDSIGVAADENVKIPNESVTFGTLLHSGHFRDIYQGTLNQSVQVSVATVKADHRAKIAAASEIYALLQCRHGRIIKLYGVWSSNNLIYIVTELAAKGNLLNFLRSCEGQKWKFPHLIEIAAQTADGMSYLEKKNIVHKNLAARHILLFDEKNIKITDFQLAIQDDSFLPADGTLYAKWIAPEAALLRKFSTKSDVWSFGIVLVELISHGQVPYPGTRNEDVIKSIHSTGYRHPKLKNCSDPMYKIMMNCWKTEPEARPTFEYLFSVFEDYFVSVEEYYEEIEEDI